ncbi:ABC transporter permease [candidate division WOR-3 bacterium]|nr:ABC transporter permease [candidate division WOR-3 bacterium]
MNNRRVFALARKEIIHVIRDSRSLGMGIAIPLLLLVFFGFALSLDVKNIPLGVYDRSSSSMSRAFLAGMTASGTFKVVSNADSYSQLMNLMDRNMIRAAIIIPENFSGADSPEIQLILDGSDAYFARISLNYAKNATEVFNRTVLMADYFKLINAANQGVSVKILYNPELSTRIGVIPGLLAVIIMIIAAMLTSLTVAREWENGSLELLISTPVKSLEIIVGKLTPYLLIGIFDVVVAVLAAKFIFGIPIKGDFLFFSFSSILFLFGAFMMGMTISIVTKNQLLACQLSLVSTFLPAFLLSGFVYDVSNMPLPVRLISHFVPAKYFISIIKAVFLKGGSITTLWIEFIFMIVYAFLSLAVAVKSFRLKM